MTFSRLDILRKDSMSPSHQAPFDKLPTEIIQDIFTSACPVVDLPVAFNECMDLVLFEHPPDYLDPIILALVCKKWRAITVTHHALWATISIDIGRIAVEDWDMWGLFQLRGRLERSGAQPLKVSIKSEEAHVDDDFDDEGISKVLGLVMEYGERWRSIDLDFPLKPLFLQNFSWPRAPWLKCLDFRPTYRYSMVTLRERVPIAWTQLSALTLNTQNLKSKEDLREILAWSSESLAALTFLKNVWGWFTSWDQSKVDEPIALPNLQQLRVEGPCTGLLDMLICPSLEHLDINEGEPPEIARFLDISACALTYLRLNDTRAPAHHDAAILEHPSAATVKAICLAKLTHPIIDLLATDPRSLFTNLDTLILDLSQTYNAQEINTQLEELRKIKQARTSVQLAALAPPPPLISRSTLFLHFEVSHGVKILAACLLATSECLACLTELQDVRLCMARGVGRT